MNNSAGSHERTVVVGSDYSVSLVKGCGALAHLENGMLELSNGFKLGSNVNITCRESYRVSDRKEFIVIMQVHYHHV